MCANSHSRDNSSAPSLHFVTQLWGEDYLRLFGETVLPGLLSDGNLGAIDSDLENIFEIYSTREDFSVLSRMPAFRALTLRVTVNHQPIEEFVRLGSYQTMSACHRRAITAAEKYNRAVVFLQPDTLLADGTIRRITQILGEGKRVILTPGFHVQKEAILGELQKRFNGDGTVLSVSPRDLALLSLRYLHTIAETKIWGNPNFNDYCSHLYWRVGDEGLLARCAHLHPLAVRTRISGKSFHRTVDWNYFVRACPDPNDWYVSGDSDEFCIADLSPESKFSDSRPPLKASVETVANWAEYATTEAHRLLLTHSFRLHGSEPTPELWAAAEDEASGIVAAVLDEVERPSLDLLWNHPQRLRLRILGQLNRISGWLATNSERSWIRTLLHKAFEFTSCALRWLYRLLKKPLRIFLKLLGSHDRNG